MSRGNPVPRGARDIREGFHGYRWHRCCYQGAPDAAAPRERRRPRYDMDALRLEFARHRADGLTVTQAARAAGIARSTGRRWDVPEGEYAITMAESDGLQWVLDGRDLDQAAETARHRAETAEGLSDLSVKILGYVRDAGHATTAQITAAFGDSSRRYLARLTETGRLVRTGRGMYALPTPVPSVPMSQSQVSDGAGWDTERDSVPTEPEE